MGSVVAVSSRIGHRFSKTPSLSIRLLKGLGVAGDAHMGETVKHRSRVRKDPTQPNLRQVHLMHAELFDELRSKGFVVQPADLGENVTTSGIDLLALPAGGRDTGQGCERQSRAQGRSHEHRDIRGRRSAGRYDPRRNAGSAASAAAAGLDGITASAA